MSKETEKAKALTLLGQQYNGFIGLQDHWDFFRGLADYTKTLQEMDATHSIIKEMERQQKASRKAIEQLGASAFKELSESAEQIKEFVRQTTKQYEPVKKALKEMQGYLDKTTSSSNPLWGLNNSIFETVKILKAIGLEDSVKQFEDNKKKIKNIFGNYTFSPTYEKLDEEEERLERKAQVEPWGAWEHLPIVQRLIFEPDEIQAEIRAEAEADPQLFVNALNFFGVAGEMEKIRSGKIADDAIVFFTVKDFRRYAQRAHSHITKKLLITDVVNKKLDFDDRDSTLLFAGEKITISKRAQSDPHDLLRTIFKDKQRIWNTDEVLDDWKFDTENKAPKNKVYQAGKAVNRIVASYTKINDFLDVTTKTVSINKKYLRD